MIRRINNTRRRFLAPWCRKALEINIRDGDAAAAALAQPGLDKPAVYHCVSRTVDRRRVLGAEEKEKFVEYLRAYEAFCMVRVLTHCVMGNHIHILVEVPEAPEDRGQSWSDDEFLRHLTKLYYGDRYRAIERELKHLRKQGRDSEAGELRDMFFVRMWDLSQFMKTLKQRFTQWFNRKHSRDGYLWSDRFRSVLVESGHAARIVAAYIDLNAVRAGIVESPEDYRWCGYAEAVGGLRRAREGLWLVVLDQLGAHFGDKLAVRQAAKWSEAAKLYRRLLFMDGEESERDRKKGRAGIAAEKVARVLAQGGELSEAEMLRCRMKHFADGGVVGTEGFVDRVFAMAASRFGPTRRSGARKILNAATPLHTLRGVRKDAITI